MEIKGTAAQKLEARPVAGCLQDVWGLGFRVPDASGFDFLGFQGLVL